MKLHVFCLTYDNRIQSLEVILKVSGISEIKTKCGGKQSDIHSSYPYPGDYEYFYLNIFNYWSQSLIRGLYINEKSLYFHLYPNIIICTFSHLDQNPIQICSVHQISFKIGTETRVQQCAQ